MPVIELPGSPDANILYEQLNADRPVPAVLFAVFAILVHPLGRTLVTVVVFELYP